MSGLIAPPARRWAISFADLALLIACVLLLGWRPEQGRTGASAAAHDGQLVQMHVAQLFMSDEAILTVGATAQLTALRRNLADGGRASIAVGTGSGGSQRLDAWELAAARTAALARVLGGGRRVHLSAPIAGDNVIIAYRP